MTIFGANPAQGSPSALKCRWCKGSKVSRESGTPIPIVMPDGSTSTARTSVMLCPTCDNPDIGEKNG